MIDLTRLSLSNAVIRTVFLSLLATTFTVSTALADINVTVVNEDGDAVNGFRWTLEEDPTFQHVPGVETTDILAFNFHASSAPMSQVGETAAGQNTTMITNLPADDRAYFISVIPYDDIDGGGGSVRAYTIGGAKVHDNEDVTVYAHTAPLPTAQISVLVFEDNAPLNGVPDFCVGLFQGIDLCESVLSPADFGADGRFSILVIDAGGRYGAAGGQITLDALGYPLGTKYDVSTAASDPSCPTNATQPDAPYCIFSMGDGTFLPDANGVVHIENLPPGKFGIQVVPPADSGWIQTSTIEGSKTTDAWVKANEPNFFAEFGPAGWHVFMGFTQLIDLPATGGSAVSGQIRNNHMSRPPDYTFYTGNPFPGCYVGLNAGAGGVGALVAAQPCNEDSTFTFSDVPAGDYGLVIWDQALQVVIASLGITVPGTGDVELGDIPVFNWSARLDSQIFIDTNENGIWDDGEQPMSADGAEVVLRWRDGTVYSAFPVDTEGFAPFDTVFPFFNWLVAEVSFGTMKATGATYQVDAGGPVDHDGNDVFNPQQMLCTQGDVDEPTNGCALGDPIGAERTLTGPVLTLGIQTFLGQTNTIQFGKVPYTGQENGGISGVIIYGTTRAENDPRFAAGEEWEPGIARVQVNLYQSDGDGNLVDQDGDDIVTAPDIDYPPLGNFPGLEDVDGFDATLGQLVGRLDLGDAVQVSWSDSWDDSLPEGCQGGEEYTALPGNPTERVLDCFDGLRNFNQIREGVFDGGYAFDTYAERDYSGGLTNSAGLSVGPVVYTAGEPNEGGALPTNLYVVEAITPRGYLHVREQDRNVDFGDEFMPQPNFGVAALNKVDEWAFTGINIDLSAPALCVGDDQVVPGLFSFLTLTDGTPLPGVDAGDPDNAAPFAGESRAMCDRKVVALLPGKNAAADFFMFTQVPVSAHVVGMILNDLGNEFDTFSPNFGEKFAPPWVPVVFRDWTGEEIVRVHADQFGTYNALVPSTFTINMPHASGVSPNMLTACMNDASPIPNPAFAGNPEGEPEFIQDPFYDKRYSQFCYVFQYMPGATTYLDTPVLPVSAFAGKEQFPLDCEIPDSTPAIESIASGGFRGPYIESFQGGAGLRSIRIKSAGLVPVRNPSFGLPGEPKYVNRDYSFAGSKNNKGSINLDGIPIDPSWITHWSPKRVRVTFPQGFAGGRYQLTVTDVNGNTSETGVTLHVADAPGGPALRRVPRDYPTIQAAIDAADPEDIISIAPGVYDELVIMYKPVQLQGWGAFGTTINATKFPAEKLSAWADHLNGLVLAGETDVLLEQELELGGPEVGPRTPLQNMGPGIIVLGNDPIGTGPNKFGDSATNARIDGITITGAVVGGGIHVNGYAENLEITNNRIASNQGNEGGGIRLGNAQLFHDGIPVDAGNDNIRISYNQIVQNGTLGAAGAGIGIFTGADGYQINENRICGNFAQADGAGIGHLGLSDGGLIENNKILFNQSFAQGTNVHGGGIFVGGLGGVLGLSPGSGSVTINNNVIQGNNAGAGDGAGIRAQFVNGQDVYGVDGVIVEDNGDNPAVWYELSILNNTIVNNVSGLSGGGISLQDAAKVVIVNNTIANNDSTATAGLAFDTPNSSAPQEGVGLAMHEHIDTPAQTLVDVITDVSARYGSDFSNPRFANNVLHHNRQFNWQIVIVAEDECFELLPNVSPVTSECGTPANQAAVYSDAAVLGVVPLANNFQPTETIFSEDYAGIGSGDPSNQLATDVDLGLADPYLNGAAGTTIQQPEITAGPQGIPALDEGGNFIDVRYGPLTPTGDYHIGHASSVAIDAGDNGVLTINSLLSADRDGDPRPSGSAADIGSDEVVTALPAALGANKASAGGATGGDAGAATVTTEVISSSVLGGLGSFAPTLTDEEEAAAAPK